MDQKVLKFKFLISILSWLQPKLMSKNGTWHSKQESLDMNFQKLIMKLTVSVSAHTVLLSPLKKTISTYIKESWAQQTIFWDQWKSKKRNSYCHHMPIFSTLSTKINMNSLKWLQDLFQSQVLLNRKTLQLLPNHQHQNVHSLWKLLLSIRHQKFWQNKTSNKNNLLQNQVKFLVSILKRFSAVKIFDMMFLNQLMKLNINLSNSMNSVFKQIWKMLKWDKLLVWIRHHSFNSDYGPPKLILNYVLSMMKRWRSFVRMFTHLKFWLEIQFFWQENKENQVK